MLRRVLPACCLLLATAATAATASADLPPPPGYRESCTVDEMQREGAQCVECFANMGDPEACEREHAELERCCQSRGATTWTEVYCGSTCPPERNLSDGAGAHCSAQPGRTSGAVGWLWLAAIGLAFARRR